MKKVIFFLLFVMLSSALANPIVPQLFSELYFDSTGWKIELISGHWEGDEGARIVLMSFTDSAVTDTSFHLTGDYPVLTSADMETTLYINPAGDHLKIGIQGPDYIYWANDFTFGDSGCVTSPRPGQSICFGRFHHIDVSFPTYYLDNSPTIGFVNDNIGAQGRVTGLVVDPYDIPIPDVVICTPVSESETGWPFFSVLTDSIGRFEFNTISFKWQITIKKNGYHSQSREVQIWPDSTIETEIVLQPVPEYYQSYFPLQVGNTWIYDNFVYPITIQDTIEIKDTTQIDGKTYYVINDHYLRYDSLGNLVQYFHGQDIIKFPIAFSTTDTSLIDSLGNKINVRVSKDKDSVEVPAGNFKDLITIMRDEAEDATTFYYFSKDIGLVRADYWWFAPQRSDLIYAKVNGVEYPTSGIQPNPPQVEKYALKLENYPNPFNQSTTINYSLPTDGDIKLAVFDINGKRVDNLFDGKQRAGSYHFIWNGGNLSSGIYFIRLRTENNVVTHKCLLVK